MLRRFWESSSSLGSWQEDAEIFVLPPIWFPLPKCIPLLLCKSRTWLARASQTSKASLHWDRLSSERPWCQAAARGGDTVVPGHCWHIGAPQGHKGCVQGERNAQAALLNGLMVREKCTCVNEIKISPSGRVKHRILLHLLDSKTGQILF